mmetsp:Transcript_41863/g.64059  ORF Transcript_41863/g.64059 Transcript_41863/m.64059 type:complete len:194 (-) Transcript_41863:18-599(-)
MDKQKNLHYNVDRRLDRRVRRSPLAQDSGVHDTKQKYIFEQRDINNTHIRRGFYVTVRDWETNKVINTEYGIPNGPFPDSPDDYGKVMWYRPSDYMHPNYTEGEELLPTFVMPRDPEFKIEYFDDKRAVYFQRIKKSIFLPRCLREQFTTYMFQQHDWIRCPGKDQEPVADEFYERLGIEKGKNYIFEFMSVF